MGAQSKKCETGAPTWIVTFADLMSLLLTFFVLLLSFSVMEIDRFKKIAGAMSDAFGLQSVDRKAGIIELDGSIAGSTPKHMVPIPIPEIETVEPQNEEQPEADQDQPTPPAPDERQKKARRTFNDIQTIMASEIASDAMTLIRAGDTTVVRFPDKVSFPSGSGEFKDEFLPVLEKFMAVLKQTQGQIIISGHTDDVPISGGQYRSNWDLSSSRAGSVAHYILAHTDIGPGRITVQGFADSRPLAPNDSPENRSKNRRVEITIQSYTDQSGESSPGAGAQPTTASTTLESEITTEAGGTDIPQNIYGTGNGAIERPPSILE